METTPTTTNAAWTQWTHDGRKYLALNCGSGVHVIDEENHNYGSWMTVERAREAQRAGELSPLTRGKIDGETVLCRAYAGINRFE